MRTFNSRIRHNLSIKLVICIKSYALSVFDIVRPFDILAVECDLKRSHIAFDTKVFHLFCLTQWLFARSNLVECGVEFGRIRLFRIYVEYGGIPANSMWDPSFISIIFPAVQSSVKRNIHSTLYFLSNCRLELRYIKVPSDSSTKGLKVMGTIASQLKAPSQNTPQSSIIL